MTSNNGFPAAFTLSSSSSGLVPVGRAGAGAGARGRDRTATGTIPLPVGATDGSRTAARGKAGTTMPRASEREGEVSTAAAAPAAEAPPADEGGGAGCGDCWRFLSKLSSVRESSGGKSAPPVEDTGWGSRT